jgi:hypothetical protein
MWRVTANNILDGREFLADFETELEAIDWRILQINKDGWGRGPRLKVIKNGQTLPFQYDSDYDDILIENEYTEYNDFYEMDIVYVDLRAEYDAPFPVDLSLIPEEATKERIKIKIKSGYTRYNIIDDCIKYLSGYIVDKAFSEADELTFIATIDKFIDTLLKKDKFKALDELTKIAVDGVMIEQYLIDDLTYQLNL